MCDCTSLTCGSATPPSLTRSFEPQLDEHRRGWPSGHGSSDQGIGVTPGHTQSLPDWPCRAISALREPACRPCPRLDVFPLPCRPTANRPARFREADVPLAPLIDSISGDAEPLSDLDRADGFHAGNVPIVLTPGQDGCTHSGYTQAGAAPLPRPAPWTWRT